MRVLLTGASGFVGRHVLRALVTAGHQVHAVSSRNQPAREGQAVWHKADLLQGSAALAVIEQTNPDALVHLAWCTTPPDYWQSAENLRWVSATLELVRAFVEAGGRRLVVGGTCAEYDWRSGYCVEGETPLEPHTLYGRAKAVAGNLVEAYCRQAGVGMAWARLFYLFGPHEHAARFVPSLLRDLMAGRRSRCHAGACVRDFLHVDDAADAVAAILQSSVTGPVNVASGAPTRLGILAEALARRLGRADLLQIGDEAGEFPVLVASVERLRRETGWTPRLSLEDAVADTVDWWASSAGTATETG